MENRELLVLDPRFGSDYVPNFGRPVLNSPVPVELCSTGGKNPFVWIAKPTKLVKYYVIKFVSRANPITNFEFAEKYVKKNKRNTYFNIYCSAISNPKFRPCKPHNV